MTEPRYLLLDEPTRGLDPVSRRELYSYLRLNSVQTSTVLITQNLDDTEEACESIAIMDRGQFLRLSTPQSLINSSSDGHLLIVEFNPALEVEDDIVDEESERSNSNYSKRSSVRSFKADRNPLDIVRNHVSKAVTEKIKFCKPLESKPFKYRNTLNSERLLIFNFDSAKDYTKASMISNSMNSGMHGSIWFVFKVCMSLIS